MRLSIDQNNAPLSKRRLFAIVAVFVLALSIIYAVYLAPPRDFPIGTLYELRSGSSLGEVTNDLDRLDVIRSPFAFKVLVTIFGMGRGAVAGDYAFESRENGIVVSYRIARGSYELSRIRMTIPEGTSSVEIAELFDDRFYRFDRQSFRLDAKRYEGYLFPDTYFFLPNVTSDDVIETLTANYRARIATHADEIRRFGRPIRDIIIMASIIEEEARTEESRRTIAGILWKRLDERMPLQVDAAFAFVNGEKDSAKLSLDDLKIDSPYNTYLYRGLPPGPISNPGLDSILATIRPIETPYYFYLSDRNGVMHYAVTHDGHVENKFKYLK